MLVAQAAQEESMPSLECNRITWGGGGERPMAASLRIQIPPGISRKGKHTKKGNEKRNSKKIQPASTTKHCQEASCFACCCHLFSSLLCVLTNPQALICKMSLQQPSFPSLLVWCPHREGTLPSPFGREDMIGEAPGWSFPSHQHSSLWNPSTPKFL